MKRMPTTVPAEKISELTTLRDSISVSAEWKRLYHCTAWYYTTEDHVFLKSYNTIVAVYERATGITYVYGRWSATTYQHVRKFRNLMWEKYNAAETPWYMVEQNLELVDMFA